MAVTDDMRLRVVKCPQCGREHIPGHKGSKGLCSKACSARAALGVKKKPATPRTLGPHGVTPFMLELIRVLDGERGRPMRSRDLAAATGRPARGPVPYCLRLMHERGLVARSPRGTYALTVLGRACAAATKEDDDE